MWDLVRPLLRMPKDIYVANQEWLLQQPHSDWRHTFPQSKHLKSVLMRVVRALNRTFGNSHHAYPILDYIHLI